MAPHVIPGGESSRRGRGSCIHLRTPVLLLVLSLSVCVLLFREHDLFHVLSARSALHSQSSPARLRTTTAAGSYRRALRELGSTRANTININDGRKPETEPDEARSISPIDVPFLQDPDGFRLPGNGISLESLGEPKSGTTWLGRLVLALALELCGSDNNLWCEPGGLIVHPNNPAPYYEFELLNRTSPSPGQEAASAPTLFLHYKGHDKHIIPGMDARRILGEDTRKVSGECNNGGYPHKNGFEDHPPCLSLEPPTRERLQACLWDTSSACVQYTASVDPAVRRSIVIFRDPRDVVLSAYKMRTQVLRHEWVLALSEEEYIRAEFEILVSWVHQRWVWHTSSAFAPSSHVVYYEDSQKTHEGLVGIAAFMGLQCSQEQALKVWGAHQSNSIHGDFTTYDGLSAETIEWMTAIMARLLLPPLARQWGVTPTEHPLD